MKTVTKIALARIAYNAVHIGRALRGLSDDCIVERDDIKYELDLGQGIDFAIYLGNFFERDTRRALTDLVEDSSTVLDIGANIGAHTLHLAKCVGPKGKVLAFEPTGFAYRKLIRNIDLNSSLKNRITSYHCFLASNDSARKPEAIYSSWPLTDRAGGFSKDDDVHKEHLGRAMQTEAAGTRSVDSVIAELGHPRIQLVKLDVDGFECEILRGAQEAMSASQPIFVMELAPYVLEERGSSLSDLFSLFSPHGYKFYDEKTRRQLSSSADDYIDSIAIGESINVIARAD